MNKGSVSKKKIILISFLLLLLIVIGVLFFLKKEETVAYEAICCPNCLDYGEYDDSIDCYDIIRENGGIRTCYSFFTENTYTYLECENVAK